MVVKNRVSFDSFKFIIQLEIEKLTHFMQDFICGVHYLEFVWPALVVLCTRTLQPHKTWYAIYI